MGTIFNLDNKFFQGVSKLIDIICLSMIWLFLCAFIIPAGAATTALYYTINKVIRHGRGYMWSEFWKAFRSNFKQSTIVWLILMALFVLLGMDCYILWQYAEIGKTWGSAYMVFIVMMGFAIMWAIYLFPYMARFANTTKIVIKNTACIIKSFNHNLLIYFACGSSVDDILFHILNCFSAGIVYVDGKLFS